MLHDPCPTKMHMLANRDDPAVRPLFELGFGKRPPEALYDLREDPQQMNNVAPLDAYATVRERLSAEMNRYLQSTGDPRVAGGKILWNSTMYYTNYDGLLYTAPPNLLTKVDRPVDPAPWERRVSGSKKEMQIPRNCTVIRHSRYYMTDDFTPEPNKEAIQRLGLQEAYDYFE